MNFTSLHSQKKKTDIPVQLKRHISPLTNFGIEPKPAVPFTLQQKSIQEGLRSSIQKKEIQSQLSQPIQTKAPQNLTGMPNNLKSGLESISGLDMSDVRVHYNSPKPAQLNAHAFAQGTNIHLSPGQEKHLAHEAWHTVQQKQNRVRPTLHSNGVAINDNATLEREADIMGAKAQNL